MSGTSTAPIWIEGTPGAAKPIISGGSRAIHLSHCSNIILQHLEVTGGSGGGLNIDDGGHYAHSEAANHLLFQDLYIHNVGSTGNQDGLKISGIRYFWINGCIIHDIGDGGAAIDMVGCHRGLITANELYDCGQKAIQAKGGTTAVSIHANTITNPGLRGINIGGGTGQQFFRPPLRTTSSNAEAWGLRVTSNIFIGGDTPFAFASSQDCVVANNTVINPGSWLFRILQEGNTANGYTFVPCGLNNLHSNIFYYADGTVRSTRINKGPNTAPNTFTASHNLYYAHDNPSDSYPTGLPITDVNAVIGEDPAFIDAGSDDFRPAEGGPADDTGVTIPGLRYDYNQSEFGSPPDIGALLSAAMSLQIISQ